MAIVMCVMTAAITITMIAMIALPLLRQLPPAARAVPMHPHLKRVLAGLEPNI